jgi:hypothetical protein
MESVKRSQDLAEPWRVGWREWLALPDLGIAAIKAKVDTGARTSSLHVERQEEFQRDGQRWVRFEMAPASRRRRRPLVCEARVVDERYVTDSGGARAMRLFIRTRITMGMHDWDIEMNLTDRRAMLFPMLLGRTAMAGRMQVDPAGSYLLGRPRRQRRTENAAS